MSFLASVSCGKVAFGSAKFSLSAAWCSQTWKRDLLKVHPTANCKATKECILEQTSFKRDVHFDDGGKQDERVPVAVDALFAKVNALKDARSDGDEAGGTEPHFHDYLTTRRGSLDRPYAENSGPN